MNGTKDWYASSGVWGGIVAIVAAVAGILGHQIAPVDQQVLIQSLTTIGAAAGGIVAVIGRMRATTVIQATKK